MPASTYQSSESQTSPRGQSTISPFSFASSDSHYTSDDLPDLGAFNTVLREWTYLQPPPRIPNYHGEQITVTTVTTDSERNTTDIEDTGRHSTVWNHPPIADYLHASTTESDLAGSVDTDTEGARSVEIETVIDEDDDDEQDTRLGAASSLMLRYPLSPLRTQPSMDESSAPDLELDDLDMDMEFQPSLGYLDEALNFIASERARLDAQRNAGAEANMDAWKHVIEPRRRRRRRRKRPGKSAATASAPSEPLPQSTLFNTSYNEPDLIYHEDQDEEGDDDEHDTTSPIYQTRPAQKSKSTPVTPKSRSSRPTTTNPTSSNVSPSTYSFLNSRLDISNTRAPLNNYRTLFGYPTTAQTTYPSHSTPSLHDGSLLHGIREPGPKSTLTQRERYQLLLLAHDLADVFPAEREHLVGVTEKLKKRRKRSRSRKNPPGAEAADRITTSDGDEEEEALDPRGRDPQQGDALVHVFVDHSNILIGLLTHLKRNPYLRFQGRATMRQNEIPKLRPPKPKSPSTMEGGYLEELSSKPGRAGRVKTQSVQSLSPPTPSTSLSLPRIISPSQSRADSFKSTPIPLPSFATAAHFLNADIPTGNKGFSPASPSSVIPSPITNSRRSTPRSAYDSLSDNNSPAGFSAVHMPGHASTRSDDEGYLDQDESQSEDEDGSEDEDSEDIFEHHRAQAFQAPRLSHTALTLLLERGRPVTRRALVTSSPLYQPMDTMVRLGYDVRIYARVPDYGDGMDRKDRHKRGGSGGGVSRSPNKGKWPVRHVSGSSSLDMGGNASLNVSAGEASKGSARSTIAPPPSFVYPSTSGSLLLASSAPASTGFASASVSGYTSAASMSAGNDHQQQQGTPARVRYREQGVDELLQLKLHQALAATDVVPEGATIVLATGDGNVGQFNDDGFLGTVRTALRRGWRVELYAWEEGLSRAWRREFGIGSEWERTGMFRIISMEQFATSLVKGGL